MKPKQLGEGTDFLAHADKWSSCRGCRQETRDTSQGVSKKLGIFLEWWQKGRLKGQGYCPTSSGEVQERLKILLSSAKFPCSFCAQFLHFPRQLIIMGGDGLVPWPCQSQGGKWKRWPGQGAKEQTEGESGWHRREESRECNDPLLGEEGWHKMPRPENCWKKVLGRCRWSPSVSLPDPHHPSPPWFLLLGSRGVKLQ